MPQVVRVFYQLPTSAGGTGVAEFSSGGGDLPPTVGSLICQVARQLGLPDCGVGSRRLVCYRPDGGTALSDSLDLTTILDADGDNDDNDGDSESVGMCSLRVSWPLPGGKTHGQIGKAGKVRRQTPHVEKAAARPKCKTGRAKKRQLYNRRFGPDGSFGANSSSRRPNDNSSRH